MVYRTSAGQGSYQRNGTAITNAWQGTGGLSGAWGWPLTDETCTSDPQCYVLFQGALATWTPAAGIRSIAGAVKAKWDAVGGADGPGFMVGPEI